MTYSNNTDERYLSGFLSYSAGANDASNSISAGYGTIVANSLAYGELSQFYAVPDKDTDIYSMGILGVGTR